MLDRQKHRIVLVNIVKEIYKNLKVRNSLGFKGGTAAYLLYDLPRFSIDLDFDLLDETKKKIIFEEIQRIIAKLGHIVDAREKYYTLFFLLRYEKGYHGIKIEISKRHSDHAFFEVKQYLGIPVLLMKKEYVTTFKLLALLTRKQFASRDMFDLWFFLKQHWDIDEKVVKERTGMSLRKALHKAVKKVEAVKPSLLLKGLGELVDEKQKMWVKEKLKDELIFQLKLRLELLKTIS